MLENCEKLNNQAIELASQGNFDEAIACFKRALTMENSNYLLWFNLGITYRDSGNLLEAQSALTQAFNLNPSDEEVIETLALLSYFCEDIDEAMYYCKAGLKINALNSHLWNTMGVIYFNQSLLDQAEEAFERAVAINPYYYDALYNLHDTYEEQGNKAGMIECSNRMRALSQ